MMKRILSFLLVLVMIGTAFSGCSAKGKLQGAWDCSLDISPMILESLHTDLLGLEPDIGPIALPMQLTFREDGSFIIAPAHKKLVEIVAELVKKLEQKLLETLQEKLSEKGVSMDMGELLGSSGLELGDLTEKLTENFDPERFTDNLTGSFTLEGYYQVKGDKLYFSAEAEVFPEEAYTLFTVEDGVLTLSEHVGENLLVSSHPLLSSTPTTFKKALFALN